MLCFLQARAHVITQGGASRADKRDTKHVDIESALPRRLPGPIGITDQKLALIHFRAQHGDAASQFPGCHFSPSEREGFVQDLPKAFYWARQAAEQNHTSAQRLVASMLLIGSGCTANAEQALMWRQWQTQATSTGIPVDNERAFALYLQAAQRNDMLAQYAMAMMLWR